MVMSNYLTPEQLEIMLNETYGDQQFSSPQGIARLNPLAFRYQNALYPGYEDFIGAYSQIDPNAPMYEDFSKPQPDFINAPQNDYQPMAMKKDLGFDTSYGLASEPDVEQVAQIQGPEKRGIESLLESALSYLPFGEKSLLGYLGDKFLPKESPEVKGMKRFYRNQYGLDPVGRVASGIMAGYNPVSGGVLNMLTGGAYGKPTRFGLAAAMQKRIENILGRKAPQTDASRARVEELRNLQLSEMRDRADRGESLSSIGKSTFSGKGKSFEAKPSGAYSKGFAGGR